MLARLGRVSTALFVTALATAWSQQNCPLPPALQAVSAQENIFSDQQEVDLGDAMAEVREITLYDLGNSEARQYTFTQPIALKAFSGDSQRLLVFATDQTVYLLDVANSSKQQPSLAVNPVN